MFIPSNDIEHAVASMVARTRKVRLLRFLLLRRTAARCWNARNQHPHGEFFMECVRRCGLHPLPEEVTSESMVDSSSGPNGKSQQ